jgi:hypothetical protein
LRRTGGDLDAVSWLNPTIYAPRPSWPDPRARGVAEGFSDDVNELFGERASMPG